MLVFQILGNADYVFTSIFTLEIILKVMHAARPLPPLSALPLLSGLLHSGFTLKPEAGGTGAPDFVPVQFGH